MDKKLFFGLIIGIMLLFYGCTGCELFPPNPPDDEGGNGNNYVPTTPEEKIEYDLESEGIDVMMVEIVDGNVGVHYNQPETEEEEIYANWGYIFAVSLEHAPGGSAAGDQIITIYCTFEDGEIVTAETTASNIIAFNNGEIDSWEFLYNVEIGCLTECAIGEE